MTTPLLLLSGAGLPDWIWNDVRDGVAVDSVVAPRPSAGRGTVTDYAQAALDAAPEGPFLLVAHSAGGVIASELARLAGPGRLAGVLAIAAVIPPSGASFTSSLPFPQKAVLPLVLRVAGTRPPESAIRKGLAAGLDEATTRRLIADLSPEPRGYFTTRAASNGALIAAPARGYVVTTDDTELPAALQRRFAGRLGPSQTTEITGGHLPMLNNPAAVIDAVGSLRDSIRA